MITVIRGPGGVASRLLAELVPLCIGGSAAAFLTPFTGWIAAVVLGVLVGLLASGVLWAVRRSRLLRLLYRVALFAHVAFWSAQGIRGSWPDRAGPPSEGPSARAEEAVPYRVGVGTVAFALPPDAPLGGWGSAPRRRAMPAYGGIGALGRLSMVAMGPPREGAPPRVPLFCLPVSPGEPVGARAMLLLPERPGAPALAFVRLDLITMDPGLVEAVLQRTPHLGLDRSTLLLSATHTHSGPGGFHEAPLAQIAGTGHLSPAVRRAVVDAVVEAHDRARPAARPARLSFPTARDRREDTGHPILARNRRHDPDLIDDRVLAIRAEDRESGATLGLLVNYAVHPVMLRRTHMAFGRDLAGALEDALGAALPGHPPVLFVNGALGDVTPRRETSEPETGAERLATAFAAAVRDRLGAAVGYPRLRVRTATVTRDLGSAHVFACVGSRAAFEGQVVPSPLGEDVASTLASVIAFPLNAVVWSLTLTDMRVGLSFDGAAGVLVDFDRMLPRRTRWCGAVSLVIEPGEGEPGPGDRALLLWLGGEPTQDIGRRWRQRTARDDERTPFLLSHTNDAFGYVTSAEEYDAGGYEALATLYGRDTARHVEEMLLTAARLVADGGRPR
jgi:neutral ceramidase